MPFTAIPAIDVRNSRVVRLSQGDFNRQTGYPASPLETAIGYANAGATWLHLVDLDAAKRGHYSLHPLLAELRTHTNLSIQTGGGVRTADDVEDLLSVGVARVVVGTAAVTNPDQAAEWLRRFGADRITLALDARQDQAGSWRLPVSGWTEDSGETLDSLLRLFVEAGAIHLLCTDIRRDGMLEGFNLDLYRAIASRWPQLEVQASGGVRDMDDIVAARNAGASVAILGRALLEGRFRLEDALSC